MLPMIPVHRSRCPGAREATVDKNVAAGASGSLTLTQAATSWPHTFETQALENRHFSIDAGNCLGRRGSGVQIATPRPYSVDSTGSTNAPVFDVVSIPGLEFPAAADY